MHVPSPAPQQQNPGDRREIKAEGRDARDEKRYDNVHGRFDFLTCMRGRAQMGELLTRLSNTTVDTARRQVPGDKERSVERCCSSSSSTATDPVVQGAYLTELCKYLAPGSRSPAVGTSTSMKSETSLLCVPKGEKSQRIHATFSRMAQVPYWRQNLLGPLLGCWCNEGAHDPSGAFLSMVIVNAIQRELYSLDMVQQRHPAPECASGGPVILWDPMRSEGDVGAGQYEGLMEELAGAVRVSGSFRGICIAIDRIVHNSIQRLMEGVHHVVSSLSAGGGGSVTGDCRTNEEVSQVVDSVVALVWREVGAFLERCEINSDVVFSEAQWLFLMVLVTGYKGAQALVPLDSSSVPSTLVSPASSGIQFRAQCLLFDKLQCNLQEYLSTRLFTSGDSDKDSFSQICSVACHQPFFWRCVMEAEVAIGRLPPALSSNASIRAWASREAAVAWGSAVRTVRCFVRVQAAVEDVPNAAVSTVAESVISSVRRCQRQLVGEHMERLSVSQKRLFTASKRSRDEEGGRGADENAKWHSYTVEFFQCVYHPSCFSILSSVKQDEFVSLLHQLHAIIFYKGCDVLRDSIASLLPGEGPSVTELRNELLQWHSRCVHSRVLDALSENSFLMMCLLHGVFVLFNRSGRTNIQGHRVLRDTMLPMLSVLCCPRLGGGETDGEDVEATAKPHELGAFIGEGERQQCMVVLIASGFLAIPWSLHGLRVRLILFRVLGVKFRSSPPAGSAVSELDRLLAEVVNGRLTPDDIASEMAAGYAEDPFLALLASEGVGTASGAMINAMEDILRRDVPVQFPAPCGALLLMSAFRTLSGELLRLRTEWEQQVKLVNESESEYLGRQATFCTTEDIVVFRIFVRVFHHMVFGFQVQPLGLLRLWMSFLVHLFAFIVPPLTEDDELVLLAPHAWGEQRKAEREGTKTGVEDPVGAITSSKFCRSPNESSQGELRATLGELLADLMLMPLLDEHVGKQCPAAVFFHNGSRMWVRQNVSRTGDILLLQRSFPVQVLEELCLALNIDVSASRGERPSSAGTVRPAGEGIGGSFLGVLGVFAFCQRLGRFTVPGSITDDGVAMRLRILWGAVEAGYSSAV